MKMLYGFNTSWPTNQRSAQQGSTVDEYLLQFNLILPSSIPAELNYTALNPKYTRAHIRLCPKLTQSV